MQKKKTLLVGLDAACWEFVKPLLEQGELPTLRKLMDKGASGSLVSTLPSLTPTAWASISTGKAPGKHGVFDITQRITGSYEAQPVNSRARRGLPFWRRLNEQGLKVGLVNIPFTYPPDEVDGFVVCGFGAPGAVDDVIYPPEALMAVYEAFGEYEPSVPGSTLRSGQHQRIFEAEANLQRRQVEIALMLSEQYDVDVLAINLMMLDHINHKMPDMERVNASIRQLDADLETLLAGFEPANVLVISDHGARRVKGDFLLHAWLRDEGYAVQEKRTAVSRDKALNWVLREWLGEVMGEPSVGKQIKRGVYRWLLKNMPASLSGSIWQQIEQAVPFAKEHIELSEALDFSKTRVYPGGSYSSILFFNMQGREPNGIVTERVAKALGDELVQKLSQLTDPETGRPLFTAVYQADELYEGNAKRLAPHIVIDSYSSSWNILSTFNRGAYAEPVKGRYFVENYKDFGHHSRNGIFVFAGEAFAHQPDCADGTMMDVPATLLHLHGVPIPEDWDGRSLTEAMRPQFVQEKFITYQPGEADSDFSEESYQVENSDEIVEHLRALGYMD